ncbi:MAG TPA: ribose-phosphate diphosphokinase [Gemmatimonadales bacterium]|nr:ribose-phosphate diphosphokinase [Gemmatimonadales bacterium]
MTAVVLALPGNHALAERVAAELKADLGRLDVRRFPDGESYVRIETPVAGRAVLLAATLARPDDKIFPLLLVAAAARDLGAASVGLVAPYLPYLRQDRTFHPGEALSSRHFAALLSNAVDWLVTVDPHLHRIHALSDIFTIPAEAVHAGPRLAEWIRAHVTRPVVIGPDEESRQWVEAVARGAGAPWVVLHKTRRGDYAVDVQLADTAPLRDRTPVLVDDIVSTGQTMIAAMRLLARRPLPAPYCVAVHGIFAEGAYEALVAEGAAAVVTSNSVPHVTNAIDVHDLVAWVAATMLDASRGRAADAPAGAGAGT